MTVTNYQHYTNVFVLSIIYSLISGDELKSVSTKFGTNSDKFWDEFLNNFWIDKIMLQKVFTGDQTKSSERRRERENREAFRELWSRQLLQNYAVTRFMITPPIPPHPDKNPDNTIRLLHRNWNISYKQSRKYTLVQAAWKQPPPSNKNN